MKGEISDFSTISHKSRIWNCLFYQWPARHASHWPACSAPCSPDYSEV